MSSANAPVVATTQVKPKFKYVESHVVGQEMTLPKQIMFQILCIVIAFTVLFPILWVFSMSVDPRADVMRPTSLQLIPRGFSLKAYTDIIEHPTSNPVSLPTLALTLMVNAITRATESYDV